MKIKKKGLSEDKNKYFKQLFSFLINFNGSKFYNFLNKKIMYLLSFFLFVLLLISSLIIFFSNRLTPRVIVAGINIGAKDRNEAVKILKESIKTPEKILLYNNKEKYEIPLSNLKFQYDFETTIDNIIRIQNSYNLYNKVYNLLINLNKNKYHKIAFSLNTDTLDEYLSVYASRFSVDPTYPKIELVNNNPILIKGTEGKTVDLINIKNNIYNSLEKGEEPSVNIIVNIINTEINKEQEEEFLKKANILLTKKIVLRLNKEENVIQKENLTNFLSAYEEFNNENINIFVEEYSKNHNRMPKNSVFNFVNNKVVEFTPSTEGVQIFKPTLVSKIKESISLLLDSNVDEVKIDVDYKGIQPDITNDEVNSLGINELIGFGESTFKGSISSRIYNIGLASSKLNGTLIKPGEIFSFNDTLGDVSALTGYKQAYIIQDGKTVLGDGGGVCQVSTTLFRAVLNTGLPVVERAPHSYRVGYYEQGYPPGLDATVYAPTTDFKFKNDTPGHILIQTLYDSKNTKLKIEIYGTLDGRIASTTKPIIISSSPPPEDLYIDDPSLPQGTIKQIDYKAWGAKVTFDYQVKKNNEVVYEKNFISNYKPWQAKFLRGTGPQ